MFITLRSHYERVVANVLINLGVYFINEVSFNHPYVHRLRYDFYLPQYNTLIEVDGQQHFQYTKMWHKTDMSFFSQCERDVRKSNFALSTGYRLLRISYADIKDAHSIIYNFLCHNLQYTFVNCKLYEPHHNWLCNVNYQYCMSSTMQYM